MKKIKQTISVIFLLAACLLAATLPVYCSENVNSSKTGESKKVSSIQKETPPINVKVKSKTKSEKTEWKVCDPEAGVVKVYQKKSPKTSAKKSGKAVAAAKKSIGNEETLVNKPSPSTPDAVSGGNDSVLIPDKKKAPLILDLAKSLKLAEKADNDLQISIARIKAAEGQYYEAKSAKNLKMRLFGSYTRIDPIAEVSIGDGQKIKMGANDNFSGQVILEKIITTFGNLENTIAGSILNIAAAKEDLETTRLNLTYNVKDYYYQVLKSQGLVQVQKDNLDIVRAQLKKTNDMYDAGVVPRFEVIRSEYYVSQGRQGLITSRKLFEMDLSNLRNLLGLDLEAPIELEKDKNIKLLKVDINKAYESAVKNRPELKSLQFSLDASRKFLKAAKSGNNPVLAFTSTLENKTISGLSSEPTVWTSMLTLNFPVFDGGESRSKTKQAEASLKELEETYKKTEKNVKLEVKRSILDLMEIEAKLEAAENDVKTSEASYNIALARYENGISTTLELNEVRRTMNTSRIQYVNLKYEYNIAIAKLEKATAVVWKGENR